MQSSFFRVGDIVPAPEPYMPAISWNFKVKVWVLFRFLHRIASIAQKGVVLGIDNEGGNGNVGQEL